jgi:hypothetical protein
MTEFTQFIDELKVRHPDWFTSGMKVTSVGRKESMESKTPVKVENQMDDEAVHETLKKDPDWWNQ